MGLNSLPVLFVPDVGYLIFGFFFGGAFFIAGTITTLWSLIVNRDQEFVAAWGVVISSAISLLALFITSRDISVFLFYIMLASCLAHFVESIARNSLREGAATGIVILTTAVSYYLFLLCCVASMSV